MLPDVEKLARANLDFVVARLRSIGYDARYLASLAKSGAKLDDALRAPLRSWHLRKRIDDAAIATRLFFDGDAVTNDEATKALGGEPASIDAWIDAGLVTRERQHDRDRIASPWRIVPFGSSWIIGDKLDSDESAVMAVGGSTLALARAALSRANRIVSACDLGCGAGALAVELSRAATSVEALDLNPRAVALASINARMNGAPNVVAQISDWFERTPNKKFSLVVSQPPFAAQASDERIVFLHGGTRGDELPLRAIESIASHLEDGGLAFVQCDWPIVADESIEARIRATLGPRGDLIFFRAPNQDLDEVVAHYASARHADLGDAYRREAIALRDHFERAGVRATCTGLAVVREKNGAGFTLQIPVRHAFDAPITREAVEFILASAAVAHATDDVIDRATLTLAPGIALSEAPDMGDGAHGAIVRAALPSIVQPFAIDAEQSSALAAIVRVGRVTDDRTRRVARAMLSRGVLACR